MQAEQIDAMDRKILALLQNNARITSAELSESVNLSPSQCHRRWRRLEELGLIRGYAALLDPQKLGLGVEAFVNVSLEKHGADPARSFVETIERYPEILECHSVTGESDYVLRVVASDLKAFSSFLMTRLLTLPEVSNVRSNVFLDELKSTTALPLEMTAAG